MKRLYLPTVIFSFFFFNLLGQDAIQLVRYPAISPDGSSIAFSYQGDIWTVPTSGGEARRLTIHESYESHPQWNEQGDQLLFQSNRYGNSDLYLMEANGNAPKQLTHYSGSDGAAKWGPNNKIYFNTRRTFAQVERISEIYETNTEGGTPFRFLDALGNNPALSPDGRYVAFERGSCRMSREAYRGPAQRDIWIYDTETKTYNQITTDEGQDVYPEWGTNNQLFYLSAQNGRYNIHRISIENGKPSGQATPLTNYTDEGIRYFDVSSGGNDLVYEFGTNIYHKGNQPDGSAKQVNIQLTGDYRFDPMEARTLRNGASEYQLSPNGKNLLFSARGEVFVVPEDPDKNRSRNLSNHAFRDINAAWLNDSCALYLSDRNGVFELYQVTSADSQEPNLHKTLKLNNQQISKPGSDISRFVLSPNREKIALLYGRGKLVVSDIDPTNGLQNEIVLLDGWSTPQDISWSPDNKWLAYSFSDLYFNREVYIHAADNSQKPVNISLHPRSDRSPIWSADGSKLGFLSNRNNRNDDVWFVWLKKSDWEKTQRDWEDTDPPKDKKKDKEVVVEIDFEDIHKRLVQVTNEPGNEGNLAISKDGETFYFTTNGGGREGQSGTRSLVKVKWDRSELSTIASKQVVYNLSWDKAGKNLYLLKRGGSIAKVSVGNNKMKSIPFQAKMTIDHPTERKAVFQDAWKTINLGFYDPNFHGQDWNALREKYEPRALAATTSQDFRDMFNEMLGQINASHMGLRGGNPEDLQRNQSGQLGIEFSPAPNGLVVQKVIEGSPASRSESSITPGETITAINGQPLTNQANVYAQLNGMVNERTLLEVAGQNGEKREVVIRPAGSIRSALYEDWVNERKRLTEKYSNGRLGYVHIQGMNWPSFERFERELTASGLGKEGMVIDVRFNGGGWTTDMLMTVLSVRQHAYTIPRGAVKDLDKEQKQYTEYYPYGERLPYSNLNKPSIALCNENSYSNAEIFSHAYKTLGLGTLVGQPTFGAVISTGGRGLIDGSYIRLPFRAWYVKATEENMEHGPAVPDILVDNLPDSKAKGEDPQLQKAVEVLLSQIDDAKTTSTEEDKE